jgi:hypothetical protein
MKKLRKIVSLHIISSILYKIYSSYIKKNNKIKKKNNKKIILNI